MTPKGKFCVNIGQNAEKVMDQSTGELIESIMACCAATTSNCGKNTDANLDKVYLEEKFSKKNGNLSTHGAKMRAVSLKSR